MIEQLHDKQPGDSLQGFVRLTVHANELTQFDGINITMAGVEYAVVDDEHCQSTTSLRMVPTKRTFKSVYSIADFANNDSDHAPGTIGRGDYLFPFEVILPGKETSPLDCLVAQPHITETILEDPSSSDAVSLMATPPSTRGGKHGRMWSDVSTSSLYSIGRPPRMTRLDSASISTGASSMSESELSLFSNNSHHGVDQHHIPSVPTMTLYKVRASLRRKATVPVSVDTDIKCIAECVES